MRVRRCVVVAFAALAWSGAWAARGQEAEGIGELVAAGRYGEAYDRAVGSAEDAQPAALQGLAQEVLVVGLRSSDSFERWFSLRAIQPLDDGRLVDVARELAASQDRYERSMAVEYLANTDPGGARRELTDALGSPFRTVRVRALVGLSSLRDPTLASRFAELAERDTDPDIRALAIRALRDIGSAEAVASLRRAVGDTIPFVQHEAVRALVALRDAKVAELVRSRLLQAVPEERLRAVQLAALVPDKRVARQISPLLADGDAELRTTAAGAVLSILERTSREGR